jgi:AsmA protein
MPALSRKRTIWMLALAAGLAVLVGAALPYVASTRLVGDRIAEEMSDWSGLEVSIGAAPAISVWPDLQANLTDVTLSLPGLAGEGPTITAERVEIELSALAALGGDIDFSSARFIRPTLRVEGGAPIPAMPSTSRIARAVETAKSIVAENRAAPDTARLPADDFGTVEFSDGRIVDVSGAAETEIATGLSGKIGWETLNGRATATASGTLRGEQFTLDLSSANPLLFLGGAATPVTFSLKSAPANLSFDGTASLGENPYAEGRASFSAPSVRKMFEWSNAEVPHEAAIGAIAVESRVMGDSERVRFEEAEIMLDGKPARGVLDLLLTGNLPTVSGTLAFDTLDLRAFLSAFTPLDASADEGPGVIDADFANRLNLDLRLSAAQATGGSVALSEVAATARVDEGLAAFDISDASAFGGTIQAGLRFDRKAAGAQVEMRLLASDIDGAAFGAAAGMTRLMPIGRGTVSVILKGEGESWNTLFARANGSFSASFGPGALSGIDTDGLLARARSGVPFTLDEVAKQSSPMDGLEVKAVVADGVARIEKAEMRSPAHRIALAGTAPLVGGSLNLSGRAEPPQQAAAGSAEPTPATTFLVNGPWSTPVVTPTTGLSAE